MVSYKGNEGWLRWIKQTCFVFVRRSWSRSWRTTCNVESITVMPEITTIPRLTHCHRHVFVMTQECVRRKYIVTVTKTIFLHYYLQNNNHILWSCYKYFQQCCFRNEGSGAEKRLILIYRNAPSILTFLPASKREGYMFVNYSKYLKKLNHTYET